MDEDEVLDAYDQLLEGGATDVTLRQLPSLFQTLEIPQCYTYDITQCIQWFYDTQHAVRQSKRWSIAEHMLRQLTISAYANGSFAPSDIVDIDKLVKFCKRLMLYRNNHPQIIESWRLLGAASTATRLSLPDLVHVKQRADAEVAELVLIEMMGSGRTTKTGELNSFHFDDELSVRIKDLAEIMTQLGQLH